MAILLCPVLACTLGASRGEGEVRGGPLAEIVERSYASQRVRTIVGQSVPGGKKPRISAKAVDRRQTSGVDAGKIDTYVEAIERHSQRNGLDPDLVKALVYAESGGDPLAVSRRGATGLMQVMPETAAEMGVVDLFDPEQNIATGTRYLRQLMDRFKAVELALWAYNAGPTAVDQGRLPRETEEYVPRVLKLRRVFKRHGGD